MAAEPLPLESELQAPFDFVKSLVRKPSFPFCWRLTSGVPKPHTAEASLCTEGHSGPLFIPDRLGVCAMVPCVYNHYSRMLLVTPDLRMRVAWPAGDRLMMILSTLRPFQDQEPSPSRLIRMLLELMYVDILDFDAGPGDVNHHEVF